MFNYKHYVPALKWKLGECSALKNIHKDLKDKFTPLIEIPPIPYDFRNEKLARKIDEHIDKVGEQIKDSWNKTNPFFLDLSDIELEERLEGNIHPLDALAEDIRKNNLQMIPVTAFDRDEAYQEQISTINKIDNMGFCLRISLDDIDNMEYQLDNLKRFTNISIKSIDLILDLQYISYESIKYILRLLPATINSIPELNDFRTFTFLATCFPQNLQGIEPNSIVPIKRYEWLIWNSLIKNRLDRKPAFGDYVITHPEIIEIDPRVMRMSANIRYTAEEEWFIFKGAQLRREGYVQFHDLSNKIVNHYSYCGEDFSTGDLYIKKCAEKKESTGNATTWRRIGTNHHITFVTKQIHLFSNSDVK
jgi:hypothetical protein